MNELVQIARQIAHHMPKDADQAWLDRFCLAVDVGHTAEEAAIAASDLGAAFGMVGDEWHGPKPPAEGWVLTGKGKRGGKIWKAGPDAQPLKKRTARSGGTVKPTPKTRTPKPGVPTREKIHEEIRTRLAKGEELNDDDVQAVAFYLKKMTVKEINEIKKELGVRAGGAKSQLADKVAKRALGFLGERGAPPEAVAPVTAEPTVPDKNAPIADQIKNDKRGQQKVQQLAQIKKQQTWYKGERVRVKEQIDGLVDKMRRLKSGRLGKKDNALLQELYKREGYLGSKETISTDRRAEEAKKILAVEKPAFFAVWKGKSRKPPSETISFGETDEEKDLPQELVQRASTARDFLSSMLSSEEVVPVVKIDSHSGKYRANYRIEAKTVRLSDSTPTETIVHEMGHHIEEVVPWAHAACVEFLKYRVGDEQPKSFAELYPDSEYRQDEIGAEDQFTKAFDPQSARYIGKFYPGFRATEVLSMGVQRLYEDAAGFADADPEYCQFVIGVLDGSLRG